MSYRDVRDFVEMLRALGYPSMVSMESFRYPNFPLVANLLVWLSKRFDPDVKIPSAIDTESDRVKLIRGAAQFMALKANIKLNTKRLYQADGYAVKELLKITTLLRNALNLRVDEKEEENFYDESRADFRDFDLSDKANELKLSRQLASEITSTGANLHDLLEKETDLRLLRQKSLGRQFEIGDIENQIKSVIEKTKQEILDTKNMIENVSATEASLDSKIEKRKTEIERYERRLQTLKKVRPAFLEEFTALEARLEDLFVQYSTRLRILHLLERLFADTERAQYEKQLSMVGTKFETIPLADSQQDILLGLDDKPNEIESMGVPSKPDRPRASTGRSRTARAVKAYGGMQPPVSANSSLSSETTDELLIDKDESELLNSDDDSLGSMEFSGMDNIKRAQSSKNVAASGSRLQNNSDDEF